MPAGFIAIGGLLGVGGAGLAAGIVGFAASAVVGAAIGGLTSAVMGGDIGKGMLFGAIGGVVVGGIGGQAISGLFGGAAEIGGGVASTGLSYTPGGIATIGGEAAAAATTTGVTEAATMGVGMSVAKDIGIAVAPELVKAVGAGILAGQDDGEAKPVAQTRSVGGGGSGGGGGGPSIGDELALQAAKDKALMDRLNREGEIGNTQISLKSDAAMAETAQDYKLQKEHSAFEFNQAWNKQKDTALGASKSQYQSGEDAYEAVVAAQKARGDQGTGRENSQIYPDQALQEMPPEEAMG